MKSFDSYYDPPEQPEAEICEFCGQEMEDLPMSKKISRKPELFCNNPFCPALFEGDAKEMAEKLVDTLDTVSRLEMKVRLLKNQLGK